MAAFAADLAEEFTAAQPLRSVVSGSWWGEHPDVIHHGPHRCRVDLGIGSRIRRRGGSTRLGIAVFHREEIRRNSHILVVGRRNLFEQAAHLGFAAEPAELQSGAAPRFVGRDEVGWKHPVGPTRDAISIGVEFVGVGDDGRDRNRLDETGAEHGGREPYGDIDAIGDHFGLRARDGLVLNLGSSEGEGEIAAYADPGECLFRSAPPVTAVAVGACSLIEDRAQTLGGRETPPKTFITPDKSGQLPGGQARDGRVEQVAIVGRPGQQKVTGRHGYQHNRYANSPTVGSLHGIQLFAVRRWFIGATTNRLVSRT